MVRCRFLPLSLFLLLRLLLFAPLSFVQRFLLPLPFPFAPSLPFGQHVHPFLPRRLRLRLQFGLLHPLPFVLPRPLLFTPRRHPFILVVLVTFVPVLAVARLRLLLHQLPLLLDSRRRLQTSL